MSLFCEMNKMENWKNEDNRDFYEAVSVEKFKKWAELGGFDVGCDLDLVLDRLKMSDSILEVGAGYGRVIEYLIKNKLQAKLYAIERSKNLCDYLNKVYGNKASIVCDDVSNATFDRKFEAIIWLWSNISDFSKDEHVAILTKISSLLAPSGFLVTDILLDDFDRENVNTNVDRNYMVKYDDKIAYGYLPTKHEMLNYAEIVGFNKVEIIPYKTKTLRQRCLFVLSELS